MSLYFCLMTHGINFGLSLVVPLIYVCLAENFLLQTRMPCHQMMSLTGERGKYKMLK